MQKTILHIDVNSAFLSWSAVDMLKSGSKIDLRDIPSAVCGDPKTRKGIILAKSIPAKNYNIITGEPIYSALQKCPHLKLVSSNFEIYLKFSQQFVNILNKYSPSVTQCSIDECFLDYTNMEHLFGEPLKFAQNLKAEIKESLGFTVNIGISQNKLLAKMASDFSKPDKIHTLYIYDIKEKMWPLPIKDLFMVGTRTSCMLENMGIFTIGDLAKTDIKIIQNKFGKHGITIWNYANGIDNSEIDTIIGSKSISNSTTLSYDTKSLDLVFMVLLKLSENVATRLKQNNFYTSLVSIGIKTFKFEKYTHQIKLQYSINTSYEIFKYTKILFNQMWKGELIRQLEISVSGLTNLGGSQICFFEPKNISKLEKLDTVMDNLKQKYNSNIINRASYLNNSFTSIASDLDLNENIFNYH